LADRIARATWIAALVASVALASFAYGRLPPIVATHFDWRFRPDGYGPKWVLFFGPAVQIALDIFLLLTKRFPITWNSMYDPSKPEDEPRIRALTSTVVEWSMAFSGTVFLALEIAIVRSAGLR